MENQEFQQHVLKWMERMEERQRAYEERMDARLASFEERVNAERLRQMYRRGIEIATKQDAATLDNTIAVLQARQAPAELIDALTLVSQLSGDFTAEHVRELLTHFESQMATPALARTRLFFEEYHDFLTTPDEPVADTDTETAAAPTAGTAIIENAERLRQMYRAGIEIARQQDATALADTITELRAQQAPAELIDALTLVSQLAGDFTAEQARNLITHYESQEIATPALARARLFFEEYHDFLTTPDEPVADTETAAAPTAGTAEAVVPEEEATPTEPSRPADATAETGGLVRWSKT